MRGRLVSKQGQLLANALTAAIAAELGTLPARSDECFGIAAGFDRNRKPG